MINSPEDPTAQLAGQLGLTLPEGSLALPTQEGGVGASIGLEHVGSLDGDVVLVLYASEDLQRSLESNPPFGALPAVTEGRYEVVPFDLAGPWRGPRPGT